MGYDWNDLRCFYWVAESGSLSAAARQLDLSQPTIGRRIKTLEQRLDRQLLKRESGRYRLTTAGQGVFELAQQMECTAHAIERRLTGQDAGISGRVSITTTECLATSWLMHQLGQCRRVFPHLDLELLVGIDLSDLLRHEADIALRIGSHGSDDLSHTIAGEAAFGLYASRGYLAGRGTPLSVSDLKSHVIVESLRELSKLVQVRELRKLTGTRSVPVAINSLLAQRRAAAQGLGIATLPCYLADAGKGDLVRVLPQSFDIRLNLWVVMHHEVAGNRRFTEIRDFLVDRLRQDQHYFLGHSSS
ncbi:MAG: LysR family transcriptional regulator [Pseudomonadota bacterium]